MLSCFLGLIKIPHTCILYRDFSKNFLYFTDSLLKCLEFQLVILKKPVSGEPDFAPPRTPIGTRIGKYICAFICEIGNTAVHRSC